MSPPKFLLRVHPQYLTVAALFVFSVSELNGGEIYRCPVSITCHPPLVFPVCDISVTSHTSGLMTSCDKKELQTDSVLVA